jgi:hypothetical protein
MPVPHLVACLIAAVGRPRAETGPASQPFRPARATESGWPRRRKPGVRSLVVLGWTVVGYFLVQAAFVLWADWCNPGLYDLEFDNRLRMLQQRRAEAPRRPLLLVMGSSRALGLFRPERLPALRTAAGEEVLPFNFAHTAAGPSYMYLSYRRLLEKGHVPRWLVLEIMPLIAGQESRQVYGSRMVAREFAWFRDHRELLDLAREYFKPRAVPWAHLRVPLIHRYAPELAVAPPGFEIAGDFDALGGARFEPACRAPAPGEVAEKLRRDVAEKGTLLDEFHPDPVAEQSLRALVTLCRQKGTRLALVLSPESPAFRTVYSLRCYQQIGEYATRWADEFDVPLLDAREWLEEGDFIDGHHPVYSGQTRFTDRLAQELLVPWVSRP